jgi:sulfotransferase family protein
VAGFEVLRVAAPEQRPGQLLDFALDAPREGDRGDGYAMPLSGWVLGTSSPATAVEVVHQGNVVQTAPVLGQLVNVAKGHPELKQAHPDVPEQTRCGFEALVGLLGLPREFELELVAALADGERAPLATVVATREPLRTSFQPSIQPLMVTSPGRTGTTWLMRMLGAHPSIVVHDEYPYESWMGKYWAHTVKVLSDPANPVQSVRAHGFDLDPYHAGHNPFYTQRVVRHEPLRQWLARDYVERLAGFFQQTIDGWYATVARHQGTEAPVYFAEKQMWRLTFSPPLTWELYPDAKEVFLVRDFRDAALSKIAFNLREPGIVKGGMAGKTPELYVRENLRTEALAFQRAWSDRGERGHLMRYEDLVSQPAGTLAALLEYLEIDSGPQAVEQMLAATPEISVHRTTPDVAASVGRWRREGDEALQAACRETFADLLAAFGYDDEGEER